MHVLGKVRALAWGAWAGRKTQEPGGAQQIRNFSQLGFRPLNDVSG